MKVPAEFDDIRAFYDEETSSTVSEILQQPQIVPILRMLLGDDNAEYFIKNLPKMSTITDFQREVIVVLLTALEYKTCKSVNLYGCGNINPGSGHIFMSNHRDIVLDSAFLNEHLFFKGFDTTQIGIGNNLLIYPWIEKLVRVNKSFIVKRDGGIKEQLLISKQLSRYIRYVVCHNKESVWLAQREGRAKDSDDRTQHSVIKMLDMSSGCASFAESMNSLGILPVAINYEYDPCDYLKAKELQQKRDNPGFKKTPADDLLSMQTGILGMKGRVSFVIAPQLEFSADIDDMPRQDRFTYVAEAVDKAIHANYILYPNNYVAADLLMRENRFAGKYEAKDVQAFERYVSSRVAMVNLPGKDEAFLRDKILHMYANPAINQLRTQLI